jgi:hypothetical protein
MELDNLKDAARARRRETEVMFQAYSATLSALRPANFLLVVGAALLSLVAGAAVLIENDFLTKTQAGVLALVSSALTIIHTKLDCDEYQGDCRKLVSFYRGIAQEYDNLEFIPDADEFRKRFLELNEELSAAAKTASALPYRWAVANARKRA